MVLTVWASGLLRDSQDSEPKQVEERAFQAEAAFLQSMLSRVVEDHKLTVVAKRKAEEELEGEKKKRMHAPEVVCDVRRDERAERAFANRHIDRRRSDGFRMRNVGRAR